MDEINVFHPIVKFVLEQLGYFNIRHHYRLESGKYIDLLAVGKKDVVLVECKTNIGNGNRKKAINQVLQYRDELGYGTPMIAYGRDDANAKVKILFERECFKHGILLLSISSSWALHYIDKDGKFLNTSAFQARIDTSNQERIGRNNAKVGSFSYSQLKSLIDGIYTENGEINLEGRNALHRQSEYISRQLLLILGKDNI